MDGFTNLWQWLNLEVYLAFFDVLIHIHERHQKWSVDLLLFSLLQLCRVWLTFRYMPWLLLPFDWKSNTCNIYKQQSPWVLGSQKNCLFDKSVLIIHHSFSLSISQAISKFGFVIQQSTWKTIIQDLCIKINRKNH